MVCPPSTCHADDIYRATFDKLQFRHDQLYRHFPWIEAHIREVCAHLDHSDELLPTGERLSSRRLRTIGIELGRDRGFDTLAYLFEDPFVTVKGEKKLRSDFLNSVGSRVSFEQGPLYAVVHESIYGGTVPGPTNWSAHRIREDKPGFEEHADPTDMTQPFYLTGEHIFPWQFEEDPALRPFIDAAHALAAKDDWRSLYDKNSLGHGPAVAAAAIYVDDVFVPFEHSMNTARVFRDLRPLSPTRSNTTESTGVRRRLSRGSSQQPTNTSRRVTPMPTPVIKVRSSYSAILSSRAAKTACCLSLCWGLSRAASGGLPHKRQQHPPACCTPSAWRPR